MITYNRGAYLGRGRLHVGDCARPSSHLASSRGYSRGIVEVRETAMYSVSHHPSEGAPVRHYNEEVSLTDDLPSPTICIGPSNVIRSASIVDGSPELDRD